MENWNYLQSCWKFRIVREATLKLHCCGSKMWVPIMWDSAWWMVNLRRPHMAPEELSLLQRWEYLKLEKYLKWSWEDTQRMLAQRVTHQGFAHLLPGFWLLDSFLLSRSFLDSAFSLRMSVVSFGSSTTFEILSYQPLCAQPAPVILISPTFMSPHVKKDDTSSGFIGMALPLLLDTVREPGLFRRQIQNKLDVS